MREGPPDSHKAQKQRKVKVLVTYLYLTLCDHMDYTVKWNSPGQNTRVGSLSLFQGIVSTQGSNLGLLHFGQILYHLSHQGSLVLDYEHEKIK